MILNIKTKPNSKKQELIQISETKYIANVKSPPQNNKANIELIKILSKHFSIPQNQIRIKTPSSREKIIEVKK